MNSPKHTVISRMSWSHYFLEFIILFFAIFLGFYVENMRNRDIDKKREKQIIISLTEDLNADISGIERNIKLRNTRYSQLDSLFILLRDNKVYGFENDLYFFGRNLTRPVLFVNSKKTFSSLKNSGDFGLITNGEAYDTIKSYENDIEVLRSEQEKEYEDIRSLYPLLAKIYNPYEFDKMVNDGGISKPTNNPYLRSTEPEHLADLAFYIHHYKSNIKNTIALLRRIQVRAKRLIEYLTTEYHL